MGGILAPSPPKPQPTQPPTPAPTQDDEALRQARKKQIAAAQQRSGRASTMLSEASSGDKLGN